MKNTGYFFVKRSFDIAASALGLILTSPILLVTAAGIVISDPGPVFYRAERVGKDNQLFRMWKFRSMRVPRTESEKSEKSFKADVSRIFPFGGLIRRLKIDELPQLINILNGTMSVVGPRPAAKDQVQIMRAGKYNIASSVRPGLTGPAALYDYIYGDEIEGSDDYEALVLPTRRELEAYYPRHMGLGMDARMIFWTLCCICDSIAHRRPEKIYNTLVSWGEQEKKETSQ